MAITTGASQKAAHGSGDSADPSPDLAQCLAQAAAGDEGAFAQLYDHTSARVHGLVLRVLRDPAQAAEVTQDAYLQVWQEAGRFDPDRGPALPWLLMIAHRRAVDRVRSTQSSRTRDAAYAAATLETPFDSVTERVLAVEDAHQVQAAMRALPGPQRQALTLAYFDGRTHREIADILGIPLGTAKTRIRDGLLRLRGQMTQPSQTRPARAEPQPAKYVDATSQPAA